MLFLLASLAASAATPAVVHIPEPAAPPRCAAHVTYAKNGTKTRGGVHRLGEEPPASEYLAVDRTIGGCSVPAVVRTGIGR